MEQDLEKSWKMIVDSTGNEQIINFINYCQMLVGFKEKGLLIEEQAAYKMINAIRFDQISNSPICDEILDIASTTEMPRELSYSQPIGKWDAKTADQIKGKEWKMLVDLINKAKSSLGIS